MMTTICVTIIKTEISNNNVKQHGHNTVWREVTLIEDCYSENQSA